MFCSVLMPLPNSVSFILAALHCLFVIAVEGEDLLVSGNPIGFVGCRSTRWSAPGQSEDSISSY